MRVNRLLTSIVACVVAITWTVAGPGQRPVNANRTAADPGVVETFPERAVGGIEPLEYVANQEQLQSWLLSEMPAGALATPLAVEVTPADLAELERADRDDPGKTVVGLVKQLGHRVDFSKLGRMRLDSTGVPFQGGAVRATADGGFVWTAAVTSTGAHALRVHFTEVRLPSTADLFVYTLDGQAFGPYGDEAWSSTTFGPTAIVQLRHYGKVGRRDVMGMGFAIADVGFIGSKFLPSAGLERPELESPVGDGLADVVQVPGAQDPSALAFCSFNESCVENAECSGGPGWTAKADAQDATALMLWISGPFINTCTGGLLADTDSGSQIPYFLTANHCIDKDKDAKNLDTFFQFTTGCGSGCPAQWTGGGIETSPHGAQVLSSSSSGDYTLLRLNGNPPSGAAFMGWTTANVANADGTALFRISHPATAPQAYSAHEVDTSAGTCQGIPRPDWIYSRDLYGATEGGSSGSPVYNSAGQVVGQLTGACGFNPGDPCDSASNATIDGAFAEYFSNIADILDPGTSCSPSPEVCDDGSDNDCDGDVDCDDGDCSGDPACDEPGGGCDLLQSGESCTDDAQCCSGKCKGPPNNQTCR